MLEISVFINARESENSARQEKGMMNESPFGGRGCATFGGEKGWSVSICSKLANDKFHTLCLFS